MLQISSFFLYLNRPYFRPAGINLFCPAVHSDRLICAYPDIIFLSRFPACNFPGNLFITLYSYIFRGFLRKFPACRILYLIPRSLNTLFLPFNKKSPRSGSKPGYSGPFGNYFKRFFQFPAITAIKINDYSRYPYFHIILVGEPVIYTADNISFCI